MANTGNTQQIINYGATANDGLGDPLRTAFIKTEENFDNIWLAGPVGSNITITNNTIGVQNTNGNLTLAPNGVGVIEARNSVLPWIDSVYDLGGPNNYWRNIYATGLSTGNLSINGDLSVGGNLTVAGNIIEIGNIVTDSFVLHLANTATTNAQANGAGIAVGANSNIATMLYNSADDRWHFNVGLSAMGNISGGNLSTTGTVFALQGISTQGPIVGSLVSAPGGLSSNGQVLFSKNGFIGVSNYDFNFDESTYTLYVKVGSFSGDLINGSDALYAGIPGATYLGSAVMAQFTGNVENYSQVNFQNISNSQIASGDYIITADNGDDTSHYLDLGLTSSNWDGTQINSLGSKLGPNQGYLYVKDNDLVLGTLTDLGSNVWKFDTTGNLTLPGNIFAVNYANGNPVFLGNNITSPKPLANLTAIAGARAFASDANLPAAGNFGSQVSGGAGNIVPIWSDGSNWYIG